jgi:hypothetical protein
MSTHDIADAIVRISQEIATELSGGGRPFPILLELISDPSQMGCIYPEAMLRLDNGTYGIPDATDDGYRALVEERFLSWTDPASWALDLDSEP